MHEITSFVLTTVLWQHIPILWRWCSLVSCKQMLSQLKASPQKTCWLAGRDYSSCVGLIVIRSGLVNTLQPHSLFLCARITASASVEKQFVQWWQGRLERKRCFTSNEHQREDWAEQTDATHACWWTHETPWCMMLSDMPSHYMREGSRKKRKVAFFLHENCWMSSVSKTDSLLSSSAKKQPNTCLGELLL